MTEKFENAPEGYNDYVEVIDFNREDGNLEAANETREEFAQKFPLHPKLWLCWINDEIMAGSNKERIENLFERALADFHSCDICLKYMEWSTILDLDLAKMKLERVIQVIGTRPDCASLVWETYLDIEEGILTVLDNSSDKAAQQRSKIESLYCRAIRIPHRRHAEIWQRYTEFMKGEITKKVRNEYDATVKFYKELESFEKMLSNLEDREALRSTYQDYIYWEIEKNDPSRVQMIFERALVDFPFDPSLWEEYVRWLDTHLKIHSVIVGVYNRACKMCYDYVPLLQRALLALERAGFTYENILEVWDQAKSAIAYPEDGISLYRTFIYLTRRKISAEASNDFTPVNDLFHEANKKLSEEFGRDHWDPNLQFRKDYAYFLFVKMKNPIEARKIWKDILASGSGNMAFLWLEGILLERHFGTIDETRKMFYRAVNSVTDDPYKIFDHFIQFEREEGTISELDKALEKVNAQVERIRAREASKKEKQGKKSESNDRKRRHPSETQAKKKYRSSRCRSPVYEFKPKVIRLEDSEGKTISYKKDPGWKPEPIDPDNLIVWGEGWTPKPYSIWIPKMDDFQLSQKQPKVDDGNRSERPKAVAKLTDTMSNVKMEAEEPQPSVDADGFVVPVGLPPPKRKPSQEPMEVGPSGLSGDHTEKKVDLNSIDASRTVFISNFKFNVEREKLLDIFENVKDLRIVQTSKNRYGYVEFDDMESAKAALAKDRTLIDGRPLFVSPYNPHEKGEKAPFKYGTGLERTKLFVKNVHYNANADDIKGLFSQFGKVKDVRIVMHKSGQSKGCAYVEFENEQDANSVLLSNQDLKIRGRKLEVYLSNPPAKADVRQKQLEVKEEAPTQRIARSSRISFIPRSLANKEAAKNPSNGAGQNGMAFGSKGMSNEDFKKFLDK